MLSRFERAEDDNYRYLIVSGPKYSLSKWVLKKPPKDSDELIWASEVRMGIDKRDYKMEWDWKDFIERIPKRDPFYVIRGKHLYDLIWTVGGVIYLVQYDAELDYPASFS